MADHRLSLPRRIARAVGDRWWLQVLAVFAASRVVTTTILLVYAGRQGPNAWTDAAPGYAEFAAIWDGGWYHYIAVAGYPTELPRDAAGHVGENAWAFLPLYPALVRLLMLATGLPFAPVAVLVSVVAAAVATLLFYRLMVRVLPQGALYATALFAFAPLSPVLQVAYSESLQLALLFGALLLLLDRRYLLLIPVIALLTFTRPGALAFALALGLHAIHRFVTRKRDPFPLRERGALVVAGLSSAALGFAWLVVAGVVTGEPSAYLETELAWRAPYVGRQELIPFEPWILGAHFWWWLLGASQPVAWVLAAVTVLVIVLVFAGFLLSPGARRLGPELRFWLASYALYLLAVFFPQSSTFRLLMPLAPALGVFALPRSPVYRVGLLIGCVLLQVGWVHIAWFVHEGDWSPP